MSGGLWPFIITEKTCFDCRHIRSRLPLRRNTSRITCKFTNDHEQNEKGRIDPQRKASPSLTKSVKLLPVPSRPFILGEAKRNESSPVTYPLDPFIWDSAVTFQKKKTLTFQLFFSFGCKAEGSTFGYTLLATESESQQHWEQRTRPRKPNSCNRVRQKCACDARNQTTK